MHPHAEMLREIYADLSRMDEYLHEDAVLHPAGHATDPQPRRGRPAVIAHVRAFVDATRNTLVMDASEIIANDHFGAVLGTIRATEPQPISMPFCGVWRFSGGLIVEHWENPYDVDLVARALSGP
ncbi:nuclear transport factor 2 family protein [Pseudonocardiaceae bacterium YIM PH 21723]|nr:nuclear transport factor 2 family protein [Pseudonocardiaceae bacterium YIM PH 21723]